MKKLSSNVESAKRQDMKCSQGQAQVRTGNKQSAEATKLEGQGKKERERPEQRSITRDKKTDDKRKQQKG